VAVLAAAAFIEFIRPAADLFFQIDVLFEFFATCTELTGERRGGVRFENWPLR
jgi:hypothetical protein